MIKKIQIGNKKIGENEPVFVIAEAGVNHNGSIELAKQLIDIAVESKADAVKFQAFMADKETIKNAPKANYQKILTGQNESQYEMLKKLEMGSDEHKILKEYADKKNIIFLSTPYEPECVDYLVNIGVDAIKISSAEIINYEFLRYISKTNKPLILSTGASTMEEVEKAINVIKKEGNENIILLQCTSNYPASFDNINLNIMDAYKKRFNLNIGFSDHTPTILATIVAVAMGAKVIEKHFTLDKNLPGPDHKASLNSKELKEMISQIRLVEKIKGTVAKEITSEEEDYVKTMRRSIVSKALIKKGTIISPDMLTFKKPGTGIPPAKMELVIGKKAKEDIPKDTLLFWSNLL